MKNWTPKTVLIVGGAAALGVWFLKGQAVETVKAVGQAVNPVNHDNIFNQGAQAVWDAVTDGEGTIGTDVYDFVHEDIGNYLDAMNPYNWGRDLGAGLWN